MQKKMLAVAVASALGAPAIGLAQAPAATSTVQIFGTIYTETVYYKQGIFNTATTPGQGNSQQFTNFDYFRTAGSEIGVKGEEQLGGGLSMWFQCSGTADIRGAVPIGWCSRNSALGMKSAWGNLYLGIWDTPFKRTYSIGNVGSGETGGFGNANLLLGGTTAPVGLAGVLANRGTFSRRENAVLNYDSPVFAGFQLLAAGQFANNSTGMTSSNNNSKPRTASVGLQYSAGPIGIGAAYERHIDANILTPSVGATAQPGGDDDIWAGSAAYTWGPVKFGGVFTRQNFDVTTASGTQFPPTSGTKGTQHLYTWTAGIDWTVIGAHGLRFNWTHAGNVKGPSIAGAAAPVGGGGYIPGIGVRPNARAPGAPSNSADFVQGRYVYAFSKRTELNLGYSRIINSRGAAYQYSDITPTLAAGKDPSAFIFSMKHTF